jgi:E3 ubiquitin-protein ligase RNF25
MPEWSEDVAVEIEALQATYGDALTLDEPLQQISMLVLPNAAGQQQQQHFVECQLVCTLSASYPSSTPTIKLRDVRGFVNRQEQLQQQLSADADELEGELLLGHLFESAKAWLSDQDHPEGESSRNCSHTRQTG